MAHAPVKPVTYQSFSTPVVQSTASKAPVRTAANALDVVNPQTGDKIQYVQKPFPTGPQS